MEEKPPRAIVMELLADVLRDNPPPSSQAKYEFRKYAGRIAEALSRVSLELTGQQKIVPLRVQRRQSSRQTREAARLGWLKRLDETGDEVSALDAAVRITMAREPGWSLVDAVRHTLMFVVPRA